MRLSILIRLGGTGIAKKNRQTTGIKLDLTIRNGLPGKACWVTTLRKNGIAGPHLEVLYHLGSMSQADICGKLLKSGGNTTLVIDNLERRGLVQRRRDPDDRRVVMVELTESGRDLISSIFPRHAEVVAAEMAVLTPEELRQLGDLCKKLGRGICCGAAAEQEAALRPALDALQQS